MSDKFFYYLSILLKGLPTTLSLSLAAIIIAGILAVLLSITLTLNKPILIKIIRSYIILFTGTPLLVQIFLIYYGSAQISGLKHYSPFLWDLFSSPWFCACLALALNSAAYTTQIFYGAIKAVPKGQYQACDALGMNKKQTLKIILSYALKRAIPTYSNEIIFVVKGTALASTITLMDIMGYSQLLNGRYYEFSILIAASCLYLLINGTLSLIMRVIEKLALSFER